MAIIEKLISGYPSGDVSPADFIASLDFSSKGAVGAWLAIAITVVFGLLVYIVPIILTERDKVGPYPLWMHTFYCAADFMGIWIFLDAWKSYNHYFLFLLLSIGEAIWVAMEVFCLQRAATYEAEINWKSATPMKSRIKDIVVQVVCFYVGLNFLRFELHDNTMWKFWIFTQVLITIVPGLVLEKRGTTKGQSAFLHVCFICVALASFNPWCNMWLAISPSFFSPSENPWYYIQGALCLFFAVRGLFVYLRLKREGK